MSRFLLVGIVRKVISSSRGDGDLIGVGAQRLHDDGAGGEFVVADDHRVVGAAAVGELHLRLHRAVVVAAVGGEPGVAEVGGEHGRLAPADDVDDERVERTLDGGEHALVVAGEQRAVEPEGEADAGCRRAAERLDEPVVAATAAEGVLGRVERAALELEDRAAVVVEAAHQLRLDGERDVERPQTGERPCRSAPPTPRRGSRRSSARRRSPPGRARAWSRAPAAGCVRASPGSAR